MIKLVRWLNVLIVTFTMLSFSFVVDAVKPKVVVFDVAGTLVKVNRDCMVLFKEGFEQNSLPFNEKLEHIIREDVDKEDAGKEDAHKKRRLSFISGYLCSNVELPAAIPIYITYIRDWCKKMGYPCDHEKAYKVYSVMLSLCHSASPHVYGLFPGVKEGLEKLKSSGYRLAIISNWDPSVRKVLEGFGISDYFEVKIISGEHNCMKPNEKIFKIALDELNLDKERENIVTAKDLVYIGDTVVDDVEGPLRVRIQPIWVTYGNPGELKSEYKEKVLVANSFKEVLDRIDSLSVSKKKKQ